MMQKLKYLMIWISMIIVPLAACSKANGPIKTEKVLASANKTLVVYFSATNQTKRIADTIAQGVSAKAYRIDPVHPYSSEDLNYRNENSRAKQEKDNAFVRPEIKTGLPDPRDYDVIYIGFPIWWNHMPKIMYTYFDKYDFSGKTIIAFCTSGGSNIESAVQEINRLEPKAKVVNAMRFSADTPKQEVLNWTKQVQSVSKN